MSAEDELREKLRKIEALFAGAKTVGERDAAGAAADRIRAKLKDAGTRGEVAIEFRFALHDPWSRKLFIALARRYGVTPYRMARAHRQSVFVKAPRSFVEGTLWPEFQELNGALRSYLSEITERLIREEVHADTRDAEERAEPTRLK